MNLWIRSQDRKRLLLINDELYIPNSRTGEDFGIFYRETMLGHYKTEERALEVLDEIDNVKWWKYMAELNFENFTKTLNLKYSGEEQKAIFQMMNTYEMPLE